MTIEPQVDDSYLRWLAAGRDRRLRSCARHRRRRRRWRRSLVAALALIPIAVALATPQITALDTLDPPAGAIARSAVEVAGRSGPATADALGRRRRAGAAERRRLPSAAAVWRARRWIRERDGVASFAVVDISGALRGHRASRPYVCASVVKALLLAAELDRLEREGRRVDPETEALLRAMITWSDNESADAIYARVGDAGLEQAGREAGMRGLVLGGYWARAQVTAADIARFFARLDDVFAGRHREFGLGLLGSVVPEQSWGVPAAAGDAWAVRFKGGWRETELGQLVHQGAELRKRDGARKLAIAVLTDGQATQAEGIATIAGTANRLLD